MEEWTIRSLIEELNRLTKLYDEGHPEVSDQKWDELYFQLQEMEKETGIIYPDSPTQNIHFEKVSELKKIKHTHPMLSLDKTKDIKDIKTFVRGHDWVGMFKLDGLSCSLVYINGKFDHADTRGNGEVGEDITHNIYAINSIPLTINTNKEVIVVDGEILCTIDDFEPFKNEYKNPRNFAAGSIRLLDAQECARRNLTFVAWDFIQGYASESFMHQLEELDDFGFITVPRIGDAETVDEAIEIFNSWKEFYTFPIDGYVFRFDNQEYYNSLGATTHHFNGAIAYKFYDETYSTRLKYIHWTMGRTGILTPVAVFDPIDIDGSTVERASLHNVSIMKETLGDCAYVGEPLKIFKSNMIIPQVYSAGPKHNYEEVIEMGGIPADDVIENCPICGYPVSYKKDNDIIRVYCNNLQCEGKLINKLNHFAGKKGLDIKGLSKATFEKLIDWGWVNNIEDIFKLVNHKNEWINKPGFGVKSVDKILQSIENSKHTTLDAFISAIGIPLIGQAVTKDLMNYFETYQDFRDAIEDESYHFYDLENFGEEMHNSLKNFDYTEADKISKLLIFEVPVVNNNQINNNLTGKTIVITGKLTNFKNRAEFKSVIEAHGGKVTDSISAKTNILINNDINSTSSKNKAAQSHNIPIMAELDFIQQYLEN